MCSEIVQRALGSARDNDGRAGFAHRIVEVVMKSPFKQEVGGLPLVGRVRDLVEVRAEAVGGEEEGNWCQVGEGGKGSSRQVAHWRQEVLKWKGR